MALASETFGSSVISKEEVLEALGDDAELFLKVQAITHNIINNESHYLGIRAALCANRLAAIRVEIGNLMQAYKSFPAPSKKFRNDTYQTLYKSLEAQIDTLKKIATMEIGIGSNA